MKPSLKGMLAVLAVAFAAQVAAQATFYENERFAGRSLTATDQVPSFQRYGFNNNTSSAVIAGERWEVCQQSDYGGRCTVLRPGSYPSLAAMGLNDRISSARLVSAGAHVDNDRFAPVAAAAVLPQVTFYERERFDGRSFVATGQVANLRRNGFNERASSAVVVGERWEVCNDARFRGNCVVLRPGNYPSLAAMGLNDRISSVRTIEPGDRIADNRYAPLPAPVQNGQRRNDERLFQAKVTSSRAVLATSGQHCWVEQEQLPQAKNGANVPAALAGALIGGILGHQVGGGSGKDIATVGGVIAGAALGAQVGRDNPATTQDVQRCENVPGGAQPAYWDVTYQFRSQDHRVQMTSAPGATILVNDQGEPR